MNVCSRILIVPVFAIGLSLAGCGGSGNSGDAGTDGPTTSKDTDTGHEGHAHGDADGHGHDHDEASLGTATIGDMQVECWQGHGVLAAGAESHLVLKLPHNDQGATVVRAWLGTEDRLKAMVGKGEYAPSHDDYDIHAEAPSPLAADTMWWIEVTKPDGTKAVGSIAPQR